MEDDFSEFKSGDPIHDIDLLDTSSWPRESSKAFSFSFSEVIPKHPALKKKSFVFPLDLELNASNLLEMISTESKPTPWSLLENIEGLNSLCKKLVDNGRLTQALRCKKHSETVSEIQRIKEVKRIATERGDYETAIQYRNLVAQLEKQLSPVEEIEEWLKEQKDTTLNDLKEQAAELGPETLEMFKEKFIWPEIQKSSDIEKAQIVLNNALQFIYLKKILKNQLQSFVSQTKTVLVKVNDELCKAMSVLFKLKPFWKDVGNDEEVLMFMKALPEVFFIAARLKKVVSLTGLDHEFQKIIAEVFFNWEEIKTFLPKIANEGKYEHGENVCGVCLFAGKGLVMLCSSYFHVTCINFWINRISVDPPLLVPASNFN
jgi:hypothetical protein